MKKHLLKALMNLYVVFASVDSNNNNQAALSVLSEISSIIVMETKRLFAKHLSWVIFSRQWLVLPSGGGLGKHYGNCSDDWLLKETM